MNKIEIKSGERHGKLTIIKEGKIRRLPSGQTNRTVLCRCDCGNTKELRLSHVIRNRIVSCGCITTKSGKPRHYKSKTNIYKLWCAIKYRVSENYFEKQLYYDKGIGICKEWENDFEEFESFALGNGYKKGLQIDRVDNNKGYYPDNCRFVEPHVNVNNRDNTFRVIYNGIEYPFMELLREKKLLKHAGTIYMRIKRNMPIDYAIDKPIRKGNYKRNNRIRCFVTPLKIMILLFIVVN